MSYLIQYKLLETGAIIIEEKVSSSAEVPQKGCELFCDNVTGYLIEDISYYINQSPTNLHHGSYAVVWLTELKNI